MGPADPARKPIDLGDGRLAGSFAWSEPALQAVVWTDPRHGALELTAAPQFDPADRGRPEATRRHRARLATDAFAMLRVVGPRGERWLPAATEVGDPARPAWTGALAGASATATATVDGAGGIGLIWQLHGWSHAEMPTLELAARLATPDLAEITETDPPPPVDADPPTIEVLDGGILRVASSHLGAAVRLTVHGGAWERTTGGARARVAMLAGGETVEIRLRIDVEGLPSGRATFELPTEMDLLTRRAIAYVRGCTALPLAPDERVILTDHRLLPLSWTRDAYYQALLLLSIGERADAGIVADHLRWLWRRCARPDGRWVRSHHASGTPKDRAFQADQQLYPLLELADYWRSTGSLPGAVDWPSVVPVAWRAALAEIDPIVGLMRSVENAADDPAVVPFLTSAQILLWYTSLRIAEMADLVPIGLDPGELRKRATRTRGAFEALVADAAPWPYGIDGRGARLAYHDANDLPLALAPLWGFCDAADPGWRSTIDFAWSAANPGMAAGVRGGLGSAHTPGPWTLGDVQDWLVGTAMGDEVRRQRALSRLRVVAFHDGMLPEAYAAGPPPDERVRHWFAWPGAALAAFRLLDERGQLEQVLGVR